MGTPVLKVPHSVRGLGGGDNKDVIRWTEGASFDVGCELTQHWFWNRGAVGRIFLPIYLCIYSCSCKWILNQHFFFLIVFFPSLLHTTLPNCRTIGLQAGRGGWSRDCWEVVMYLTSYSVIRLHWRLSGDFRLMLSHWTSVRPSAPCCSVGTFQKNGKSVADKSRTPCGICVEQALGWNHRLVK